ncbi:MAG: MerR family transcriptional regulator [Candidatus Dormibacteria bacterium]
MESVPPPQDEPTPRLKIGEAATLTGVTPGRIRHYQRLGLVSPTQSASGYRYFNAQDLVRILQIDLLRSLGMGLEEIRASLPGTADPRSLREALERHRDTLRTERARLDGLLAAVQTALEAPGASAEAIAAFLASAHSTPRESLGIFGRLSRPLSAPAAASWQRILGGGWELPVDPIFARMLLPPQVTEVMEQLAQAPGNEILFDRVRGLAAAIVSLAQAEVPDRGLARECAVQWIRSFELDPLPEDVQSALDRTLPRVRELDMLNQGFQLWAESISPVAATVLRLIQEEAKSRRYRVLGVLPARGGQPQG